MNVHLWPGSILLKFVSEQAREPVSRLLVYIEIPARRKNPFAVGPFLSDGVGEVCVSREKLSKEIATCWEDFPMDYTGSLEESGAFVVVVSGSEELQETIGRLQQFYPIEASRLRELCEVSSNGYYNAARTVVTLPIWEQPIVITLTERKPSSCKEIT